MQICYKHNVQGLLDYLKLGIKVITFNGCFDILTVVHMNLIFSAYLEAQARKGIVICGLNSDESVKKYKGSKRPIMNEIERAKLLLATGYINYVYIYDEETSIDFVNIFNPSYHFNSASYGENCVEAEALKECGGELIMVPSIKCPSTTDIVNRVLERYRESVE